MTNSTHTTTADPGETDRPVTQVRISVFWEGTPYDGHWAFAYTTDHPDRDDYDFRVEFHESADQDEQRAVIRLIEAAPGLLSALQGVLDSLCQRKTFPADVENARRLARNALAAARGEKVAA